MLKPTFPMEQKRRQTNRADKQIQRKEINKFPV